MKKFNSYRKIALSVFLLSVSFGDAQETKKVSITNSPFHLVMPVLELMAEYQVAPKIGAAGILGYGNITEIDDWGDEVEVPILEIGGQLNYYLLGNFDKGMQVGLEVLYLNASAEDEDVSVSVDGLAVGPYLGYKWTAGFGLTFDIQAGYEKLLLRGEAEDKSDDVFEEFGIEEEEETGIPLLNINIGWSF